MAIILPLRKRSRKADKNKETQFSLGSVRENTGSQTEEARDGGMEGGREARGING